MATLEQVCAQVQSYLLTLTNVRSAPPIAPDLAPTGLFTLTYPESGVWEQAPVGMKRGLHRIRVGVDLAYTDAVRDLDTLYPFFESVPNLLFEKHNLDLWNGLVDTIGSIEYAGPRLVKYNDVDHWIVGFTVNDVKMKSAVT